MIYHTENATTVQRGQSIATVIADSISPYDGSRITTLELVYPRYIHGELMTHRVFSRNASSSRATPLKVTLEEVRKDPVFFDYIGRNKAGMVADEEVSAKEKENFRQEWFALGRSVADRIELIADAYGIHKQTLNRALEPWTRIRTLVTATDWDNFFDLRLAADAQPEMQMLARAMEAAMEASQPVEDFFHTPYVDRKHKVCTSTDNTCSIARCARVSYARHDGKTPTVEEDEALYWKLRESKHLSPFEHCAFALKGRYANFTGWKSARTAIEG